MPGQLARVYRCHGQFSWDRWTTMAGPGNVLLITADQMRRDHIGGYGSRGIRTPRLNRP